MYLNFIYAPGKRFKIGPKSASLDKKFRQVEFPYTSAEFLSGIMVWLIGLGFAGIFFMMLNSIAESQILMLLSYLFFFGAILVPATGYLYGANIYYTQGILKQKEEMLQALLEMANYLSLNTSIEYAFMETTKGLSGILGKQFRDIALKLEQKKYTTLQDAFEEYIPIWLDINPDFVKGLNMIQTSALAPHEEREPMLRECIKTIIQSYYTIGKRSTETLSNQAKSLISIGVMLPMMSLIMLPLISIFLPQVINVPLLIFLYDVSCPALLLLFAMQFALNRVQVNTIDISLSQKFRKMPPAIPLICAAIIVLFALPAAYHFMTIDMKTKDGVAREYETASLIIVWLMDFGIFLAVVLYTFIYTKLNEKTWNEMREVEEDIPHLLQIISSYLVLNRPMESILGDIKNDYIRHGFKKHSVVKILGEVEKSFYNTKKTLGEIVETKLPEIIASKRLLQIFRRIVHFADIDIASAAKSAKMIRSQTLSIFRLDNYLQTLLNDTFATVSVSMKGLAPILASTAVIMAVAIVMSLVYIEKTIGDIASSVGLRDFSLQLVDASTIIPPTVVMAVVGTYVLLTLIILATFLSNIKYGSDRHRMAKTILESVIVGFLIYSMMLLFGVYAFTNYIFTGVMDQGKAPATASNTAAGVIGGIQPEVPADAILAGWQTANSSNSLLFAVSRQPQEYPEAVT
ncbi:MAG: hypothetical protein NT067_01090 [Candidatus Diapherotrites archaeon]|nr:hypothetical protein [Candidatus Diapherotrites archaeon]